MSNRGSGLQDIDRQYEAIMNTDDIAYLTIAEISELLNRREISAVEITEGQLERIGRFDARLNAFITVLSDEARASAVDADRRRRQGEKGPLLGVPLAVKDLFATAGIRTTAGSRVHQNSIPTETAVAVQHLETAGMVLLGKTNMMEFAYGYPHPDFGETRNPWAYERTAGGSSGGSAAAVAAGMAYGGLGTDTGGSVRSPAAYCGVTGLKPTYGRVSCRGVVPLSWSLDHVGPLTRSVLDAAILYDAIASHGLADTVSVSRMSSATAGALDTDISGRRVGVVDFFFERHVTPEVRSVAQAALENLRSLGVDLVNVKLPCAQMVGGTIMPILMAEATSYHWPTVETLSDDYSRPTLENLRRGAAVLAKDYLDAQRVRRLMRDEVTQVLEGVEALVFPTQPIVAPALDAYQLVDDASEDVLDVEIGHTGLANLTGHPAISVPCGFTDTGLPVGLQFTGRSYDELMILQIAHGFEQSTPWHRQRPRGLGHT
jgi:aspartyl-tRNA(Asn)/glutamyl-tRNA(Gln) amidotransferase subunit A